LSGGEFIVFSADRRKEGIQRWGLMCE